MRVVQRQRLDQGAASGVLRQQRPQAAALQQRAHIGQPARQRARRGQRRAQRLDLRGERLALGDLRGLRPAAHGALAQGVLQRGDGAAVKGRRQLEPVQHGIGAGGRRAGAQRGHQRGAGVGGGQAPAGFVVQRRARLHAARGQQGVDAARQAAVGGHQRNRRAAGVQVAQHAGGGALGLVFGVQAAVQRNGRARRGRVKRQQHGFFAQVLGQVGGQRIGLQARHDHQRVQRGGGARGKQHVAGVVRMRGPGDGDVRQPALQRQRPAGGRRQRGAGALGPVGAQRRRQAGGQPAQQAGLLQQRAGQGGALAGQAGAFQQGGGGEQIARGVEHQIVRAGHEQAGTLGPAARGLEARRETVRKLRRPQARGQRQQLGIGQQHHAARRVRRQLVQLLAHLGQQRAPGRRRGSGAQGFIANSYGIHSDRRCRAANGGMGLSVTIRATLSAWITPFLKDARWPVT